MKIQFAYGNPRKKKRSKAVAKKKRKSKKHRRKAKAVKRRTKRHAARKPRHHRRKHKAKHSRKARRGKRRNPVSAVGWIPVPGREKEWPGQKKIGKRFSTFHDDQDVEKAKNNAALLKKRYEEALKSGDQTRITKWKNQMDRMGNLQKIAHQYEQELNEFKKEYAAFIKAHPKHLIDGSGVRGLIERSKKALAKGNIKAAKQTLKQAKKKATKAAKKSKGGSTVAKKKKRSKSFKGKHRHGGSKLHLEKGAVFTGKLKRKGKKKKGSVNTLTVKARKNPRRKKKTSTHSHKRSTFHVKKGGTLRVKNRFMGFSMKANPIAGALGNAVPLIFGDTDVRQLAVIAVGGAATPLANYAAGKLINTLNQYVGGVPGVSTVLNAINSSGLSAPVGLLVVGRLVEEVNKRVVKNPKLSIVSEGLILSAAMGAAMILSQKLMAKAGLSGVLYTPGPMGDVRFTPGPMGILPTMGDVRYTPGPMGLIPRGLSGLGSGPDFGKAADYGGSGGYTQEHKFSKADFGGMTLDEDADEVVDDSDIQDDNLSGSMV